MIGQHNAKVPSKWLILAISFLLMTTFAISLQALPPLFNQITKDIPFSNSQAGMLMGAYAIPGIFLPFLVAFLAQKFNKKNIILFALLFIMAGLIAFSLSGSFLSLLLSRLVAGIGATVLLVLAPLLVTMFFDRRNMGIAMGIFNSAVPFGTVVAANLFGLLGAVLGWRLAILEVAVFTGIILAINFFVLFLPNNRDTSTTNISQAESPKPFRMSLGLLSLALIWTLANAQLLAYITFGPQFFQLAGMSMQGAGLLTSFVMLMPIFVGPIVGIIMDKTGWKKQLLLVGSIMMAVSFVLFFKFPLSLPLWAVTLGIGFAPIPVFVFATLPEIVDPRQVGMGLGVLTAASNLGITLGPTAFGFVLDATAGEFFIGFVILALVSVGIILSLLGIKTKGTRTNPSIKP